MKTTIQRRVRCAPALWLTFSPAARCFLKLGTKEFENSPSTLRITLREHAMTRYEDQVAEHRDYLYKFARLQLRNEAWAEDAVSEPLLAALAHDYCARGAAKRVAIMVLRPRREVASNPYLRTWLPI
jgi:hypothetical protein